MVQVSLEREFVKGYPFVFLFFWILGPGVWGNKRGVFVGLAYYQGNLGIVFRFIIEYSSFRDFLAPRQ